MNADNSFSERSEFVDTISPVRLVRSVRAANLDFFGPIALVCVLGAIAHFIQSLFI